MKQGLTKFLAKLAIFMQAVVRGIATLISAIKTWLSRK